MVPERVWPTSSSSCLARPKSVIFGVPSLASRMLAGLMSRWMMPDLVASIEAPGKSAPAFRPNLADGLGLSFQLAVQAAAVEVFQRAPRFAVVLTDVVNLNDVRVLNVGDGFAPRCGNGRCRFG